MEEDEDYFSKRVVALAITIVRNAIFSGDFEPNEEEKLFDLVITSMAEFQKISVDDAKNYPKKIKH